MKAVTEFFYFLHQISKLFFKLLHKRSPKFFFFSAKKVKKKYFYFLHERSQQSSLYLLHSFKIPEMKEQRQKNRRQKYIGYF